MSSSYSVSATQTTTVTNARYLASKVATDLMRFSRLYGSPTVERINEFEEELTILLKNDAVDNVVYGFKRNGLWTLASVRYIALPGGALQVDDDPGRIKPNHDVAGAVFTSFMSYSAKWFARTAQERAGIEATLPINRSVGDAPGLERGRWEQDRSYSSGNLGLGRSTVRT